MRALWMASGIAVWALHFTALYGLTALACARGSASAIPWIIGLSTALAGVLIAGIAAQGYRGKTTFIDWITVGIAGFALIGVLYEAAAGLLSPLCV
jgi:hypothetical protein